jgi:hypothetical protein
MSSTDETRPRGLAKGFSFWPWMAVCVVLAAAFVYFEQPLRKSSRSDAYVCLDCGLKELVVRRWRWRILVQNSTNFEATAISTAFGTVQSRPCPHRWVLTYFDIHGRTASGHGKPGGITLFAVLEDQRSADELTMIGRTNETLARSIWNALCIGSFETNRAAHAILDYTIDGTPSTFKALRRRHKFPGLVTNLFCQ